MGTSVFNSLLDSLYVGISRHSIQMCHQGACNPTQACRIKRMMSCLFSLLGFIASKHRTNYNLNAIFKFYVAETVAVK